MPSKISETIPAAIDREAFTVAEFCRSIGISRAFFYKLPAEQRPGIIRLGRRVLITREAAANWRELMAAAQLPLRAESASQDADGGREPNSRCARPRPSAQRRQP